MAKLNCRLLKMGFISLIVEKKNCRKWLKCSRYLDHEYKHFISIKFSFTLPQKWEQFSLLYYSGQGDTLFVNWTFIFSNFLKIFWLCILMYSSHLIELNQLVIAEIQSSLQFKCTCIQMNTRHQCTYILVNIKNYCTCIAMNSRHQCTYIPMNTRHCCTWI